MDKTRFEAARRTVSALTSSTGGIGTLGEKPLHAVVKHYLAADPDWHEQKIGRHIVDIFTGERVIEIQTRQFNKLRSKLTALLPLYPITIVYPMPARKWLVWLDPQSGELSRPRLSPRRGHFSDVFFELYRIKPFLNDLNLSIHILQIDLEEYRLLNGWSRDRKRGAWRNDRLPLSLEAELMINGPADYCRLMPDGLPDNFTSADLAKAAQMSVRRAQTAVNVLLSLNIIEVCGKAGRRRLYRMIDIQKSSEPKQDKND